jgi:vacuole morphology and inheritance protein 14
VLACFSDQDARVRYYACESMYNIAKVAKGEVLVYFNDVFDALCKLSADSELSVKNGAELLDRLIKDIVSESAATYASILAPEDALDEEAEREEYPMAFSLPRFIPLLQERIHVTHPFTRSFLTAWITLLDSIPDLELVAYLPSFLGGLLKYLTDSNHDVHQYTKHALDKFLVEIKKIAAVKKGIAESRRTRESKRKLSDASPPLEDSQMLEKSEIEVTENEEPKEDAQADGEEVVATGAVSDGASSATASDDEKEEDDAEDEWIPGQDVPIDFQKILDILITFLSESQNEQVQVTTLKWIEAFLDICPEDILLFTPRLLGQVLPALSHDVDLVKQAASRVNQPLMNYVLSLPEEPTKAEDSASQPQPNTSVAPTTNVSSRNFRDSNGDRRESAPMSRNNTRKPASPEPVEPLPRTPNNRTPEPPASGSETPKPSIDFDYEAAVNALTLQFLHEHEATRVAALAWLIMLHRKSPRRILAIHAGTFPALLKTLSDPAEAVVTRDLLLLSQISKNSDESYFTSFMQNLLSLFCTDRSLLQSRGNLIIRQLSTSLSAERIYRTLSDILITTYDTEEDIEFSTLMVQNLNNNLITAPELADLRKRLRQLDSSKESQTFFTVLFKAWCGNAVATFSLCLLAQAYEQAYNLLQAFADMEMTVNTLIQIDKLVQLLESPVFTYLRMQLLEPERFPHLYKCMYGLLMLLPQSSAFAALKNRLNSVSAIGYLHIAPRTGGVPPTTPSSVSTFERQNRLKSRDDGGIKWAELLEKFRSTQDRVRRVQLRQLNPHAEEEAQAEAEHLGKAAEVRGATRRPQGLSVAIGGVRPNSAASFARLSRGEGASSPNFATGAGPSKVKTGGLGHLGRLAGGVAGKGKAKK